MSESAPPIRIAISGGGMAGAILMHALLKYPHLDVHIFESAPTFNEPGIAIGILRNARTALEMIGPSASQCLERAGAVPETAFHWTLARGPDAGKMICEIRAPDGGVLNDIVSRASFIRELLDGVPETRMHASKKLANYDVASAGEGPVTLHFADGTTHDCDVLIGADGIRSRIRQSLLGANDPAAHPQVLGEGLVDANRHVESGYFGDGAFWMHNVLSGGEQVQCALCVKFNPGPNFSDKRKDVDPQELEDVFSSFPPVIRTAVKELMCGEAPLQGFYMWEHLHASTYAKGPVCITGDAAHSSTPWQASGAGMSIEDALILSSLLGKAKSPAEACVALKVYDETRRPRTQQIVDSSRRTGDLATGSCRDIDVDDLEKMREELEHRWDFIIYIDMQKHLDDAVELMTRELQREQIN